MNTVLAVVLAHSLVVALPAELPDRGEPIEPHAYTQDLETAGIDNGRLPAELLTEVPTSETECLLEREAADAWSLLVADAAGDGISIDAGWCYRSLEEQQRTYARNCGSVDAPKSACDPVTATPGRSNHGWARAIDATSNGLLLSCSSDAFGWLVANAESYGWVHPSWAQCGGPSEEPWHWEWGGTTTVASQKHSAVGRGHMRAVPLSVSKTAGQSMSRTYERSQAQAGNPPSA